MNLTFFDNKINIDPEINLQEKLCGYEFTLEWILRSLINGGVEFDQKNVLKRVESKDISGGKGMFSVVLKINLVFENQFRQFEECSTVLKIPTTATWEHVLGDIEDVKFGEDKLPNTVVQMHNAECDFYENLASLIPKYLPKVFQFKKWERNVQYGCIHMEDLSMIGKNLDYVQPVNVKQFRSVIDFLAYFHSKIMLLNENAWRGKFTSMKKLFFTELGDLSTDFLKLTRNGKNELEKLYFDEKIQKIMKNKEFTEYAFLESFKDIGLPMLIVHGDLWSSNIMYKVDDDGHITDDIEAILDWQCVHEGNWLFDFVRMTICSLDGETRREMELTIFDYYLERLRVYLDKAGFKDQVKFTAKDLRRAYDFMFLAHFKFSTIMSGGFMTARGKDLDTDHVESAYLDKCTLRAIHVYEDALRLLNTGDYDKWL